jgi:hypothetical protein
MRTLVGCLTASLALAAAQTTDKPREATSDKPVDRSSSATQLFIPLSPAPRSLLASVVTVDESGGISYRVACPSEPDPACPTAVFFPPARVVEARDSVFAGEATQRADLGTTSSWRCDLRGRACVEARTNAAGESTTSTRSLGSCDVAAGRVPVIITAGIEKLHIITIFDATGTTVGGTVDASSAAASIFTSLQGDLTSLGCAGSGTSSGTTSGSGTGGITSPPTGPGSTGPTGGPTTSSGGRMRVELGLGVAAGLLVTWMIL